MNTTFFMDNFFPIIVGAGFLYMGLYVLITKKPLIYHSSWFLVILGLLITAKFLKLFFKVNHVTIVDVSFFLAMIICFLVIFFYILNQVSIFGIDVDHFQNQFTQILEQKGLECEPKNSSLIFKEPTNLILEFGFQKKQGSVQIKMKKNSDKALFNDIIAALKNTPLKHNKVGPTIYLIFGLLIFSFEIFSYFFLYK